MYDNYCDGTGECTRNRVVVISYHPVLVAIENFGQRNVPIKYRYNMSTISY